MEGHCWILRGQNGHPFLLKINNTWFYMFMYICQLSWFLTFIWIIGCKCTRYANSEYNKTIHYKETSLNHFQHSFIYYRLCHYTMAWLQVVKSQIVITMVQYSKYQLVHDSLDNNKLIDDLLYTRKRLVTDSPWPRQGSGPLYSAQRSGVCEVSPSSCISLSGNSGCLKDP